MRIIVGLGNLGPKYADTRHNVGFYALELLEKTLNKDDIKLNWKEEKKLKSITAKFEYNGEQTLFVKPTTFMNLSGKAVSKILSYYKSDTKDLSIIYDDIDLEIGTIRIRDKGSAGTHNGMKSIIQELGTNEFKRIRIGIESRGTLAPEIRDLSSFVLSKFSEEELKIITKKLKELDLKAVFT